MSLFGVEDSKPDSSSQNGIRTLLLLTGLHLAVTGLLSAFYLPFRVVHSTRFALMESQGIAGLRKAGNIDVLDVVCLALDRLLNLFAFPFGFLFLRGANVGRELAQSSMAFKVLNSLLFALAVLFVCFLWKKTLGNVGRAEHSVSLSPRTMKKIIRGLYQAVSRPVNLITQLVCWSFIYYLATSAAFLYEASLASDGRSTWIARALLAVFQFPLTPFLVPRHYWVITEGYELVLIAIANSVIGGGAILALFLALDDLKRRVFSIGGLFFCLIWLAVVVCGQLYAFSYSPVGEMYAAGVLNVLARVNEKEVYMHLNQSYGLLYPYRIIHRKLSYKDVFLPQAQFRSKKKKRANIDFHLPSSLLKRCMFLAKELHSMSDEQAETSISKAVAVLRSDDASLNELHRQRYVKMSQNVSNKDDQILVSQIKEVAELSGAQDMEGFLSTAPKTNAIMERSCALKTLQYFGNFAVGAAPTVIEALKDLHLVDIAADTLRTMAPLEENQTLALEILREQTPSRVVRDKISYVMGEAGNKEIMTGRFQIPKRPASNRDLANEVAMMEERGAALKELFNQPDRKKLGETLFKNREESLEQELSKYSGEHPNVAEIMMLNEVCGRPIPKREMDAFREICRSGDSGLCRRTYEKLRGSIMLKLNSPRCGMLATSLVKKKVAENRERILSKQIER